MADGFEKLSEVPVDFIKDGSNFLAKCKKPDQKGELLSVKNTNNIEYMKIIRAVGVGFIMMGAVGYAVKLVRKPFIDH